MDQQRIAVVAGATGVAGSEIISTLLLPHNRPLYSKVIVLSRKAQGTPDDIKALLYRDVTSDEASILHCVKADLLNEDAATALAEIIIGASPPGNGGKGTTRKVQLFYTAMFDKGQSKLPSLAAARWSTKLMGDFATSIHKTINMVPSAMKHEFYSIMAGLSGAAYSEENLRMLSSCIKGCELAGAVEHVSILTGGKMYGMQYPKALCPESRPPYVEDSSRGPPPNFYMAQEALVLNSGYAHTIVRPSFILGVPPPGSWNASSMSIGLALGTYCAVLHAAGSTTLPFPGSTTSCDVRMQMSATPDIARILTAGANDKRVANQAFNVVSCESFTWREVWPHLAAFWGMKPVLPVRGVSYNAGKTGLSILAAHTGSSDLEKEWKTIAKDNDLLDLQWKKVFNDDFFDKTFSVDWDTEFSTLKLEQYELPYGKSKSASYLFLAFFANLIKMKVIPAPCENYENLVAEVASLKEVARTDPADTVGVAVIKKDGATAVHAFGMQQQMLMAFGLLFFCGFANNITSSEVAILAFSGWILHAAYEALLIEERR
jgi:nucleoside-diphosphate-sugar epimerase